MKRINLLDQANTITHLTSNNNYTTVHLSDSTTWLLAKTLKACLLELKDFVRIHRQFAVNPAYVTATRLLAPKLAEIAIGDTWMPVSRRLFADVDQKLGLASVSRGRWHYVAQQRNS